MCIRDSLCYVGDDGFVIVVHLRHEVIGNGRVDAELHLLRVDVYKRQADKEEEKTEG